MKTVEVSIRTINRLNKLAKDNKVVFSCSSGSGSFLTLTSIRFLKAGENYAEEDCLAVFCEEIPEWIPLEDCEFFILNPVKI